MQPYKVHNAPQFFILATVFILLLWFSIYFEIWFFIAIFSILFVYSVVDYLKKHLARIAGPEIGLWIYTGSIGVSFAYLSIALFRQDKKFTKVEFEKLSNYFLKEYGEEVGKIARAFVLKFKRAKVDPFYQTREIAEMSHKNRLLFLYNLFSMAMANGILKVEEERYLKRIAKLIYIDDLYYNVIRSKFVKPKDKNTYSSDKSKRQQRAGNKSTFNKKFFSPSIAAYLSLELDRNASNDEVKKAYRRLVMKYHPDRLNGQSETNKKIAKHRFREITEAYELIKKERGMK